MRNILILFLLTFIPLISFSQNGYWCDKDFIGTQHRYTVIQDAVVIRHGNINVVDYGSFQEAHLALPYYPNDLRPELQRYNDDGNGDFIYTWKISNNNGNSFIPVKTSCDTYFKINQFVPGQVISYEVYYINNQSKVKCVRSMQLPDTYVVPNTISNFSKYSTWGTKYP